MNDRTTRPLRRASREDALAHDPLRDYFVWWDDVTRQDIDAFERVVDGATGEGELQQYLQENPLMLIQHLGGGHGRWVIPQKRLGSEFVTDFIIGERSSQGFEWTAVELESPTALLFNKNGDPSPVLRHAIRQVTDWRAWLEVNQNYAARPRQDQGLGLTDISPNSEGLILIGRARDVNDDTRAQRRRLSNDLRIRIHTYDWMVRLARGRVPTS